MNIIITKIDRDAHKQQLPVIVHVTFFDSLGREIIRIAVPAAHFKGNLEMGQQVILVPKGQAITL